MAIWIFSNLKLWAFQCCYEHFARHFLVNICLHFCYLSRVELLGKGMHMFSFNSSCKRVFQYYTFFFPINSVRKSSSCFTPSPKLGMFNRFTHLGLRLSVCVCVFTHICAHVCVCFSSVQSPKHVRLCDPRDCTMPGFPVHHQFPELAQTHVHIFLFQNQFHCDLIYI